MSQEAVWKGSITIQEGARKKTKLSQESVCKVSTQKKKKLSQESAYKVSAWKKTKLSPKGN
jgi:hypothetical protein